MQRQHAHAAIGSPASSGGPPRRSAKTPSVLLVAAIDAVGIARLPRLFQRAGVLVTLLAPPGIAAFRSRHISKRIVSQPGIAPLAEELWNRIRAADESYDLVVLCDEVLMRYVAGLPEFERYASVYPVPMPERYVVLSNVQFISRAHSLGLALPDFEVCDSAALGRQAAARLGYPVMLKADYGMAGSGVRMLENETDWCKIDMPLDRPFLIQRYVDGQVGATNILFDNGIPICSFSFYKKYNWPSPFSPSGGSRFVQSDQVSRILEVLGKVIRFRGLCSIDWVQESKSGRISVIEFNPRPTPSLFAGIFAGADFSTGLSGLIRGQPTIQQPPDTPRVQEFVMFPESVYHAIDNRKFLLFAKSLAAAPIDDPWLLCAYVRRIVTHYARRCLTTVYQSVHQ